jgi:hypothetical protein
MGVGNPECLIVGTQSLAALKARLTMNMKSIRMNKH